MSYTYINRKGNLYHLHQGKTKTGKPKYYFSKSDKGNTIDSIPDCYEVYENPNAQVFLIKDKPKLISDREVEIVNESIRNYSSK